MTDHSAKTLSHAAELVREVNHTAAHHSAYTRPSEVYDAYGSLMLLAERLSQAIHQHAEWIATETDRGGVEVVSGEFTGDPAAAAAAVEHHSGQAAEALVTALQELNAAHNIVAAMASARDDTDDEV